MSGEDMIDVDIIPNSLFVVENGLNTCYIDSLLMALFYKQSTYLDNILYCEPKDSLYIYLQEVIKHKFVTPIRNNISVLASDMNEIRLNAHICGWLAGSTPDELLDQQDVNEFYSFLLDVTNGQNIKIQRQTIYENNDNTEFGEIESLPFISLSVPDNTDKTSVKELLNDWMNNNVVHNIEKYIIKNEKKELNLVNGLNFYKIINVPMFIGLSFNRFGNNQTRIQTMIDVQKKIKLYHINDENEGLRWTIHSLICHKGESNNNGHYYSIIYSSDNKWLIFDDLSIPCLQEIDIKNQAVASIIQIEVVFVIYCFDESF